MGEEKKRMQESKFFSQSEGRRYLYQMVDGFNLAEVPFFKYITNGSPFRSGK
jgi:hypothetical protein